MTLVTIRVAPLWWPQTVCSRRFLYHPRLENNSWRGRVGRRRTPSARRFLLIELVITTILAVLAAGVHVPIVGSSDSAAKKEDRKEDGAPPVAEEQA